MKKCKKCGIEKPLTDFWKSKKGYYCPYCRTCDSIRKKKMRQENDKFLKIKSLSSEISDRFSRDYGKFLNKKLPRKKNGEIDYHAPISEKELEFCDNYK